MEKSKYVIISLAVILFLGGCGTISSCIGLYNTEVQLRTRIEAKQVENKTVFDNTWKKIKQSVQVSDMYKDGFKEVLTAYTTGRKDDSKQLLMKWGNEAIPNFDSSIYKQLNNIIISSRDDFTNNQKELIDLNREHDKLLSVFPNNLFFNMIGTKKIDIKLVTSTKTDETFATGHEDEVNLK